MCYEVTHAFSGMVWQLRVVDSEETARTIAMVRIESGQEHELQQVPLQIVDAPSSCTAKLSRTGIPLPSSHPSIPHNPPSPVPYRDCRASCCRRLRLLWRMLGTRVSRGQSCQF
jgi:hypothetical protein